MSPLTAARRRGIQRVLLALAGLLVLVLLGVLAGGHGSASASITGPLAGGVAVCLLAAGLLPSDTRRPVPPPARPGGGYGRTDDLVFRTAGRMHPPRDIHGEPDRGVGDVARANGWSYRPRDAATTGRFTRPPLQAGADEYDVVTGSVDGTEFVAFSYGARIAPGRPPAYRVVAVPLPAAMPPVAVGPERLIGPVAPLLGLPDVDIESERFNRAYRVLCRDRRYAVAMLAPRTAEMLLASEPFCWRIDGDVLLSWDESLTDPASLPTRVDQVTAIVRYAPAFLWGEYGAQ